MQGRQSVLKILVVGESEELRSWLKKMVSQERLAWRLRFSCNLRVGAPENQIDSQDMILVLWEKQPLTQHSDVINRLAIERRSFESVIRELGSEVTGARLRRTLVIGHGMTREDTIFLAESQVGGIFSLPPKLAAWERQISAFIRRVEGHHANEVSRANSAEERVVGRFLEMLSVWDRVSDEMKMKSTEQLLRVLGDSSRYAELLAKKCIAEKNFRSAEQWLQKSISKNPNYFSAMQLLSDVYFEMGKGDKSLELLEKLRESNPRSVQRLVKIAKCHIQRNEYDKADKVLSDALCIDEFYAEAREQLGRVKIVLGDYESARSLLRHTSKNRDLAHFLNKMGIDLVARAKFKQSIEHYKKAQFVLPGNEQSHLLFFNIGLAYAKWGKLSEARKYVNLALIRQPNYEKAINLLQKIEERLSA